MELTFHVAAVWRTPAGHLVRSDRDVSSPDARVAIIALCSEIEQRLPPHHVSYLVSQSPHMNVVLTAHAGHGMNPDPWVCWNYASRVLHAQWPLTKNFATSRVEAKRRSIAATLDFFTRSPFLAYKNQRHLMRCTGLSSNSRLVQDFKGVIEAFTPSFPVGMGGVKSGLTRNGAML